MDAMTPPGMLAMQQALIPEAKPVTHDVTIVTTKKLSSAKVLGVPPEEFGIEKNARSISDANYAYHDIVTKTEGQLIAEGYDEAQVKTLATWTGSSNTETLARDTVFEHQSASTGVNSSARIVAITEHYVRLDYEGNGKPCLYMVITGSQQGEILRRAMSKDGKDIMEDCVYPIDAIPFAAATPVPMTHRFIGRSIADLVMDIQRIKTALVRGALDNSYLHNAPRPVVSEAHAGPNTIDDLLTVRQGAPIRVKHPGGIEWQTIPDITPSIFPMLQYMDATREIRTGMSNQSQGIDANALQNQSATAVAQVFSASQMRMKLVARILAEGVKDIFSLLHGTIRKHGQQAQTVRLRNSWIDIDPRQWKTRNDMTIHVGLGTGDKAQQYAQMMGIANFQKELILGGKGHMVPDSQIFNTASELVKLTGHKNPDKFFADPAAVDPKTGQLMHPPAPPPEDPKVTALKLKAQTDQQAAEHKAAIEKIQAEADIATQDRKTQAEIALAKQKAELDAQLKLLDFGMKEKEHEFKIAELNHKMAHDAQMHQQAVKQGEMGMIATAHAHDTKMEQMKAKPEKSAKASIDIKHGGDEVGQLSKKIDAQTEALHKMVGQMGKPKKVVRDKAGKLIGVE